MADIKEVVWHSEFGEGLFPFCPYCDEFAYEEDHCVFCKKPYKWVDSPIKDTMVEVGEYTVVQTTNNHISITKGGRMVYHAQCTKRLSKRELKKHVNFYEQLVKGNNYENQN